jgi:hypothetical protein
MSHLSHPWLMVARSLWAFIAGLGLVLLITAFPVGLHVMRTNPPDEILAIVNLGLSLDFTNSYLTITSLAVSLIFWVVAGLMVWRRSNDGFVLMISGLLIIWGVEITVPVQMGMRVLVSDRPAWFWIDALKLAFINTFLFLLGYLFPNGLFVPRWTWVPALLTLVLLVPGTFFPGTILDPQSWGVINLLLAPTAFAIMVLAQVYRYRRASTLVERQQTKWFVSGFAALVVVQSIHFSLVPALIPIQGTLSNIHRLILLLDYSLATISLLLIPIPIAIGILRYRLWDIDMLIRRTLIHGTLTGILAAVYFMNVIALLRILPARSQVSVVLSTLLIAALFTPLRRRIQNKIDRRFYQKKYDAGVITATFATTLRHEVDLETLSAALTSAIAEVMEPEHISLWMKDGRTGKLVQR